MITAKPEPITEEQEEVVLEDNQLICLITGDIKPSELQGLMMLSPSSQTRSGFYKKVKAALLLKI
jgi:hypothetical protein